MVQCALSSEAQSQQVPEHDSWDFPEAGLGSQPGCALEACPPVARQIWTDELYTERTLALEERTQAKHTCQLYTRSPLQNTGLECEPPLQNTIVWCSGSTDTSTAHVHSKDTAQQTDLVSCTSHPEDWRHVQSCPNTSGA